MSSNPFFKLAKELSVPYGDVLLYADSLNGREDAHTEGTARRLSIFNKFEISNVAAVEYIRRKEAAL